MPIICGLIFTLIFLLTILKELKNDYLLNRFPNLMLLIPTWSFFAPTPNMFDYHLLYLLISDSGEKKDWVEVYSVNDRSKCAFFWYPEKIFIKAFLDITIDLLQFSSKVEDKKQICTSIPYLQLLNFLDPLPKERSNIQFMILTNSRVQNFDMAFLSETHPLST